MAEATPNSSSNETGEMEGHVVLENFIATGRTGRRNAMPNILNSNHAGVGTGGLAEDMEKLNCTEGSQGSNNTQNTQNKSGQGS